MFSSLCPSIQLKRLKIPCQQWRAGSGPAPSNSYNQYFRIGFIVDGRTKKAVRTQILRTRPELTSIISVSKDHQFSQIKPKITFFLCGKRGKRGTREKRLPHFYLTYRVTGVTNYRVSNDGVAHRSVKFSLHLRKKYYLIGKR